MNAMTGNFDKVCAILDKYERSPKKLIAILQEMQAEYGYLPEELMTFVATALEISPARVYGVATFYSHFTLSPKGKYVLRLCDVCFAHFAGTFSAFFASLWIPHIRRRACVYYINSLHPSPPPGLPVKKSPAARAGCIWAIPAAG